MKAHKYAQFSLSQLEAIAAKQFGLMPHHDELELRCEIEHKQQQPYETRALDEMYATLIDKV